MAQIQSLYTMHGHNERHVEEVMDEMRRLGAPEIRVVDCADHYVAIEGVHRLEAAARLGIPPCLIVLEQDDIVDADSLDIDILCAGESYAAAEIAGECYNDGSGAYALADDGTIELRFNGRHIPA